MTVVVTGSAGFIGSHLSEELIRQGFDVVGVDNFHPYYSEEIKRGNLENIRETESGSEGSFSFEELDLADDDLSVLPQKPEYVFHLAGIAGVRHSVDEPEPYVRDNVYATSRVIDYFDPDKFVFSSSSSVYGDLPLSELPVDVDREVHPEAPYPLSQVQCEEMFWVWSEIYDFDYAILRYFSVYGPRQRPDQVFTKFIKMALNGEPLTVYGDGKQTRDFTYVGDVVNATIAAARHGEGTFNVGSGRRVSVNDVVSELDDALDVDIEVEHVEQPPGDARHTHADIEKTESELPWDPSTPFPYGLKKTVEWALDEGLDDV